MNISINGERREIANTSTTVSALLVELGIDAPQGVAIAKNMTVVPRSQWATEPICDGDAIEIVRATQGG